MPVARKNHHQAIFQDKNRRICTLVRVRLLTCLCLYNPQDQYPYPDPPEELPLLPELPLLLLLLLLLLLELLELLELLLDVVDEVLVEVVEVADVDVVAEVLVATPAVDDAETPLLNVISLILAVETGL